MPLRCARWGFSTFTSAGGYWFRRVARSAHWRSLRPPNVPARRDPAVVQDLGGLDPPDLGDRQQRALGSRPRIELVAVGTITTVESTCASIVNGRRRGPPAVTGPRRGPPAQ